MWSLYEKRSDMGYIGLKMESKVELSRLAICSPILDQGLGHLYVRFACGGRPRYIDSVVVAFADPESLPNHRWNSLLDFQNPHENPGFAPKTQIKIHGLCPKPNYLFEFAPLRQNSLGSGTVCMTFLHDSLTWLSNISNMGYQFKS